MKIKLNVSQRILLDDMIGSVPGADRTYWKLAKGAREVLAFSEKELEIYGIKVINTPQGGAQIHMSNTKDIKKVSTYTVPDRIVYHIIEQLEEKDKAKTLTMQFADLLEALQPSVEEPTLDPIAEESTEDGQTAKA